MVRGFVVLMSAFVAVSAQAQDVQASKAAGKTNAVATPESGERTIVLASRSTPELRSSPLVGSTRSGSPDGRGDTGPVTRELPSAVGADCSIVEFYLGGASPVVRTYQPPPAASLGAREKGRAPYVESVARCGHLYIFQVTSKSRQPWVIKGAKLESPNGEEFQVNALRFRAGTKLDRNVIVAEAPPGVSVSQLTLHLTGGDGRVAKLDEVALP